MGKSLAEYRANPAPARPERSRMLCLAPNLVAEVQHLAEEHSGVTMRLATLRAESSDDQPSAPRRQGDGSKRREVESLERRDSEIRDRLAVLLDEMAEHEGELRLRANLTDGEWRRWCNEHPARTEDTPGADRDDRVAFGFCNADDLIDNLGAFVHSWNGEPLAASDWAEVIEPRVGSGDKAALAQQVIDMYENPTDFPHWRSALQGNLKRLSASASPGTSASPTSDSTDGSPAPLGEATTATGSPAA